MEHQTVNQKFGFAESLSKTFASHCQSIETQSGRVDGRAHQGRECDM